MTREENKLLTQVGPGTPMGDLMREYWLPAIMGSELEAETGPIRVRLLGENLIAFRTLSGSVSVMDQRCPHRCASLFYGRIEHDGIRCTYHGWKFNVDGQCLEQPNVERPPAHISVKARAYRAVERGGLVWVYMGSRAEPPALPDFPVFSQPDDKVSVWCEQRECNYLQCIEGELDTSHASFLHLGMVESNTKLGASGSAIDTEHPAVRYKTTETETGVLAGGYRPAGKEELYWRFAQFHLPFWTQPPPCELGTEAVARAWVPMDDTHTMLFAVSTNTFCMSNHPNAILPPPAPGLTFTYERQPNTSDWFGRWRMAQNAENDYRIDRAVQQTASYSGIEGLDIQDMALQESMGPISDRTLENLVGPDQAIVVTRRCLSKAALRLRDEKVTPPGVDKPEAYRTCWAGFITCDASQDWQHVYSSAIPSGLSPRRKAEELVYGN